MPGGHCISNFYARSFPNPSSWPWPSEVETGNLTWLEETESSEKHVRYKTSCVSTFWEDVREWSCWSCVNYTLQFRDHHRASQVSWLYSAGTDKGYKVFDDCIRTNTWHCRSLRVKPFCWVFGFNPPPPLLRCWKFLELTVLPLDVAVVQSSVICSPLAELLACYWAGRVI